MTAPVLHRPPAASSRSRLGGRLRATSRTLAVAIALFALLALIDRHSRMVAAGAVDWRTLFGNAALLLVGFSLWLRDAFSSRGRVQGIAAAIAGASACAAAIVPQLDRTTSPWWALVVASLGMAVATLDWEPRSGLRPAQWLALASSALPGTILLGHLYAAPPLYTLAAPAPVSVPEGLVLALLGAAVLSARPDSGLLRAVTSETPGGVLARSMPLAAFAVPAAFGWLAMKGQWLHYLTPAMGVSLFVLANALFFSLVILGVARTLDRADERRTLAEEALWLRARQRAGVAQLGQRALSGLPLPGLVDSAVRLVADGLPVAWGEFLEYGTDDEPERAGAPSLRQFVFANGQAIIIDDLPRDERMHDPALAARGVISAALVIIQGAARPYGALAAYSPRPDAFGDDDLHWLQTVAGVLTRALERQAHEDALRLSEEKFAGLFRSSPDAIIVAAQADRTIFEVNEGFLDMTGLSRSDVIGRTLHELDLWSDANERLQLGELREMRNVEVPFRTRSGEHRIGLASTELVTIGDQPYSLTVVRDVSERRKAEAAMQEANERLTTWVNELEARSREISLLNEMGDLLQTCLTSEEVSTIAAQYARQLLPGSCGAIFTFAAGGKRLHAAATWGILPADDTTFGPYECWGLRRGRPYGGQPEDIGLTCGHVHSQSGAYLCVPMMAQGESLGILHARGPAADTTDAWLSDSRQRLIVAVAEHVGLALANVLLRERLHSQSIRDQLTGLYNRRYLEEALETEIMRAHRSARPLALLLLDLDEFKAVNDTYGHDTGDELLRAVSHVLKNQVRAGDIVCRYGGEEFLFVLPDITLSAAIARAEEIRLAVRGVAVHSRHQTVCSVTTSVGIAIFPDHGIAAGTLLQAADAALYRAKARGGNCLEWPAIEDDADTRQQPLDFAS